MNIVTVPTPTLREPSRHLTKEEVLEPEMQAFITDLVPFMYDEDGIGVAAPQVGENVSACIIGKDAIPRKYPFAGTDLTLINPSYIKMSKKMHTEYEGCLSVPGSHGPVRRAKDIEVTALDKNGEPITFEAHGFFARVIQHEIDHLNGILYIDRAEKLVEMDHPKKIDFAVIQENVKPV